jgi:hypothetical protein
MRSPWIIAALASAALATAAAAQGGPPPAGPPQQDPYKPPSGDIDNPNLSNSAIRDEQIFKATRDAEMDRLAKKARAVAAKPSDVVAGREVRDSRGVLVGTVESVDAQGAVVAAGAGRVMVPLEAFGVNKYGLILEVTKAEFETLVANATAGPAG